MSEPCLWRIAVSPKRSDLDVHGHAVLRDIHDLGLNHVSVVASTRLVLLEGALAPQDVERIARELLSDPVTETFTCAAGGEDRSLPEEAFNAAIEVHLKGGVMDPVADSTLAVIRDMGVGEFDLRLSTARLY